MAGRLLRSLGDESEDGLDDDDRARLHAALAASDDDLAAGSVRGADEVIADLRRRRT
jgi:hypothetical protein